MARDRRRSPRPVGVAWRAQHDRGVARGRDVPPAILFAVATLFVIIVLLHYSTVLSQLDDQSTVLAQRVALLEQRLDQLSGRGQEPPGE